MAKREESGTRTNLTPAQEALRKLWEEQLKAIVNSTYDDIVIGKS